VGIDTLAGLRAAPVVAYDFNSTLSGSPGSVVWSSWWGQQLTVPVGGGEPTKVRGIGPLPADGRIVSAFTYNNRSSQMVSLYDVLWVSETFTVTAGGSYTFTAPSTLPARGNGGLGCQLILSSFGVSNLYDYEAGTTITYTNSAGVGGRTSTPYPLGTNPVATDTWIPSTMQTGDLGVRSVQSMNTSTNAHAGNSLRVGIIRHIASINVPPVDGSVAARRLPYISPRIPAGAILVPSYLQHVGSTAAAANVTFEIALDV
jgi:hypothetical protein